MKSLIGVVGALVLVLSSAGVQAAAERGTAEATLGGKKISIDYGRPNLEGRDMLGKAPSGFVWRLGSNSPTRLTTDGSLAFGKTMVAPGTYILTLERVDEKSWALLVKAGDEGAEPVRVPMTWTKQKESTEALTLGLTGKDGAGTFAITWGLDRLETSFSVK